MSITNKVVVFTGRISKPRHEFQQLVLEHGGINGLNVTKSTDYLVVGEKPGSKLGVATLLGVPCLTEEAFMVLLDFKEPSLKDEKPLTAEQHAEFESHMTDRVCKWCGGKHRQFDTVPDYSTCPICEIRARPMCPKCSTEPVFVELLKSYYCQDCNLVFEAPHSERVYYQDHIHVKGMGLRCVICHMPYNSPIKRTPGKVLARLIEARVEQASTAYSEQVASWKAERGAIKWADSLSSEQRAALLKSLQQA